MYGGDRAAVDFDLAVSLMPDNAEAYFERFLFTLRITLNKAHVLVMDESNGGYIKAFLEQGNAEMILSKNTEECKFVVGPEQIFFERENGRFNYYFINFRSSRLACISKINPVIELPDISVPIFVMREMDDFTEGFSKVFPEMIHEVNALKFLKEIPSCHKWFSFLGEVKNYPRGQMQFWHGGFKWSDKEMEQNGLYRLGQENYGHRYYYNNGTVYRLPVYEQDPCIGALAKLLHVIQQQQDKEMIYSYNPETMHLHWKSVGTLPMILARAFHLADLKNHEKHYEHKYCLPEAHYKEFKRIIHK